MGKGRKGEEREYLKRGRRGNERGKEGWDQASLHIYPHDFSFGVIAFSVVWTGGVEEVVEPEDVVESFCPYLVSKD